MKAETCSQCGGLIKNVSPNQTIFECEYCGAKDVRNETARLKIKDSVNAFAVDAQNNIYTVSNDVVRKLKPFNFRN